MAYKTKPKFPFYRSNLNVADGHAFFKPLAVQHSHKKNNHVFKWHLMGRPSKINLPIKHSHLMGRPSVNGNLMGTLIERY